MCLFVSKLARRVRRPPHHVSSNDDITMQPTHRLSSNVDITVKPPHRLFSIGDIIFEIAKHLDWSDFLRFASTSKTTFECLVPMIWREVFNRAQLVNVLPQNVQMLSTPDGYLPSRQLTVDDFLRLSFYGQFVRRLNLDEQDDAVAVTHNVLPMLACHDDIRAVFPEAQSLQIVVKSSQSVMACAALMRMPLSEIYITVYDNDFPLSPVLDVLTRVQEGGSRVTDFALLLTEGEQQTTASEILSGAQRWEGHLFRPFEELLSNLPRLKGLALKIWSDGTLLLPQLGAMPFLETLHIVLWSRTGFDFQFALPAKAFAALKDLAITFEDSHFEPPLESLLFGVSSTQLSSLEIHCRSWTTVSAVLGVVAHKWSETFESLELVLHFRYEHGVMEVPPDAFHPLSPCRGLLRLHVSAPQPLDCTDEHYDMISSTWPGIETLTIACPEDATERRWTPKATRRSFELLARRCRSLQFLCIQINFAAAYHPLTPLEVAQPVPTSVLRIDISSSKMSARSKLSSLYEYLKSIFPHALEFRPGEENQEPWEDS